MKPVCRVHRRPLYFVRVGRDYTIWVCPDERHDGDLYRAGDRR